MNKTYPSDAEVKKEIIEIGRRMYDKGFANANDGNISAKVSESTLWATPTNISKGFLTEDQLVKLDLAGNVLEGSLQPSSEIKMHLAIYRENAEVLATVHAHPPVATTFAAAGIPLDQALLQEAVVLLGVIPLAPYCPPGSSDLAESVVPFCRYYNGILLEHHGAVAWGESVTRAYYRMESIEYNATVYMYSKMMGVTRPIKEEKIDELIALRPAWGVTAGGRPKGRQS
jgi:L-fuculose-phosphate aldolase